MTRATLIAGGAALAALLLFGCAGSPAADPDGPAPTEPSERPTAEVTAAPSTNTVPVGPPDVRARALGVAEPRIEAIQADTRAWWQQQTRYERLQICRQLTYDARFMAAWMGGTGLPEGPEQELAAQTLLGLTQAYCWRFRDRQTG